ncbi:MAG: 3-hydroxyacyl-CoA dehydrogenase family protein [Candidatus Brocadiia bacterium]
MTENENDSGSPADIKIKNVAVVGCGQIGVGIGLSCALHRVPVALMGREKDELLTSRKWVTEFLDTAAEKGTIKRSEVYEIAGNFAFVVGIEHLKRADLVIECVNEDLETKKKLFTEIKGEVKPTAVVSTNTSVFSIRELAECFGSPDRFLGTHFFTPVPVMKLVEVVATPDTSRETIDNVMDFCMRIGKQPVLVKDSPGFIVNKLLTVFLLSAMKLYQEGNAPEDIDTAIELALGHKAGPLKLADSIGLDVIARMAEQLHAYHGDECYSVPDVLKQHIERGRLGRKTNVGFYRY